MAANTGGKVLRVPTISIHAETLRRKADDQEYYARQSYDFTYLIREVSALFRHVCSPCHPALLLHIIAGKRDGGKSNP